jgi:adenine-specific DNA-methyltransferase
MSSVGCGAGIGSLSLAFLERWRSGELDFNQVALDAFEIDPTLLPHLQQRLHAQQQLGNFSFHTRHEDFILASTRSDQRGQSNLIAQKSSFISAN